ncbi:tripartite tricarboxylate transporter substrate binding protein [Piscinibacter sakaiensis]|uniref:tripartite tricarboxylate transporter substrate binding protein n=1 Tax=Piscinibacter sakaiensis TaxID=1547922 RepID=UPI003AAE8600
MISDDQWRSIPSIDQASVQMTPMLLNIAVTAMLTLPAEPAQTGVAVDKAGSGQAAARQPGGQANPRADPRAGGLMIRVAAGDWGGGDPQTIRLVLEAVAAEMLSRFSGREPLAPIHVSRSPVRPVTLFERGPHGEYRIELNASGRDAAPYIYEFAHELCHVLSNYERHHHAAAARSQQWFEEALCEVASLYSLKALANRWQRSAPTAELAAAAPGLLETARRFQQEAHRRLPTGTTLAGWYALAGARLGASAYDRNRNEVVANLLLPLFEENPELWGAISFLNLQAPGSSFRDYLQSWLDNAPPRYKDVIRYTISLFFRREAPPVAPGGDYPSRPLQIIVTFGPGGGADGMARKLAELLEPQVGMPVLVENVAGASGNAGLTKALLSSDPEHTLVTLIALTAAAWADGVGTIGASDFTILGIVQQSPSMLFVRADSPLADFEQFLAAAARRRLSVATSGRGTLDDLTLALLGSHGYLLQNAPFALPRQRYQATLDGRTDALFEEPGDVAGHLAAGALRPLVVFAGHRHAAFPAIPAIVEFGLAIDDLPNFRSLAVRAGVAADKVEILNRAIDTALRSDEWQHYCARTFSCASAVTPTEAAARVRRLVDRVGAHRARLPR